MLTFADAEVIKMAQDRFIPVAADDWYQRRRKDEEGAFFRLISDQGPRKSSGASGTRQGIYVFTAAGKLLAFRNHHDPDVMKAVFRQALAAWDKLPAADRAPGAVKIADPARTDAGYERKPPKDAAVVNVFTRILDKDAKGAYCHGVCGFTGGDRAAHDRLWLTREECLALVPRDARASDKFPLAERLLKRIARFHLADNTRGEPPHWRIQEIRGGRLDVEVMKVDDALIELKLTGAFLLATDADPAKAQRGFDAAALGHITLERKTGRLTRFSLVVVGNHWGSGPLTRQARPGRMPLGVAFELSPGDTPSDRVPPQGARWLQGYIEAEVR